MEDDKPTTGTGNPSDFLETITGSSVVIKLNSGVVYKGELQSVDGYMNIALEKTREIINDVENRYYGDAFIRGNNDDRQTYVWFERRQLCEENDEKNAQAALRTCDNTA